MSDSKKINTAPGHGHINESTGEETLLEFPCNFPIKAFGYTESKLEHEVGEIIRKHFPDFDDKNITVRPSSKGKFTAMSILVRAESKAQLDAIYQDLVDCESVKTAM